MKTLKWMLLTVLILGGTGYVLYNYWSQVFSRRVSGKIEGIERIDSPVAVLSPRGMESHFGDKVLFSFAIAIRQKDGEIVTASSEDRQWAIARAGQCAEARYFPYPPWNFDKWGSYFGARLTRLSDCDPADWPEKKE